LLELQALALLPSNRGRGSQNFPFPREKSNLGLCPVALVLSFVAESVCKKTAFVKIKMMKNFSDFLENFIEA
jgi:hypothetical protein